jgi:hypothetical protein
MSRRHRITTAIALLSLAAPLASALFAQSAAQDSVAQVVAAPVVQAQTPAPITLTAAPAERATSLVIITPAGVTQPRIAPASRTSTTEPYALRASSQGGHSPAMMVVGGAAMIVGAVVGGTAGTIVMIGGGILGLVGLWNYMQ